MLLFAIRQQLDCLHPSDLYSHLLLLLYRCRNWGSELWRNLTPEPKVHALVSCAHCHPVRRTFFPSRMWLAMAPEGVCFERVSGGDGSWSPAPQYLVPQKSCSVLSICTSWSGNTLGGCVFGEDWLAPRSLWAIMHCSLQATLSLRAGVSLCISRKFPFLIHPGLKCTRLLGKGGWIAWWLHSGAWVCSHLWLSELCDPGAFLTWLFSSLCG